MAIIVFLPFAANLTAIAGYIGLDPPLSRFRNQNVLSCGGVGMVDVGDDAPRFTASLAHDGIEPFDLESHLGDGPIVLAFYPAAFSNTCTTEVCTLRDGLGRFEDVDATVFGVSTDLPHAQDVFRAKHDLPFGLIADPDHHAIEAYDVVDDAFEPRGVEVVARRAVFVIDSDGVIRYRWLAEHPGKEPDYDAVVEAVADSA